MAEEAGPGAPRVPVDLAAEAVDRTSEDREDQMTRKLDLLLSQGKVEQAIEHTLTHDPQTAYRLIRDTGRTDLAHLLP
jgi:hypothetical protein